MKWKSFESPRSPVMHDFARLAQRVYDGDRWHIPVPARRLSRCFDPEHNPFYEYGSSRQFVVYDGADNAAARCAAGINPRMNRDGDRVGTIGFFEACPDPAIAAELFARALHWLGEAGVTRVYGPMNFSIWSGYRCKTAGFDIEPYLGEPYNMPYYGNLFQNAGFTVSGRWHSSVVDVRPQAETLRVKQEQFAERVPRAREAGYEIIARSSPGRGQGLLREIYDLIMESYAGFFGFYRPSWREFADTYGDLARIIRRNQLLLARHDDRLAGALIQHWDWADAMRGCRGRPGPLTALRLRFATPPKRWIMSVLGVRRAAMTDGSKIASAMINVATGEALRQGAEEIVFSLMSETNRSNVFAAGLDPRRTTYTLFESKL